MEITLIFLAALFLAYTNGSNDNFKGTATLFGSKTLNYNKTLWLCTITTLAGAIASVFFAEILVKQFSGKGLVAKEIAISSEFIQAVGIGAGLTVMIATIFGLPISTTHSLTGALVGGGYAAVGNDVKILVLGEKFFLPLLISPIIAVILSYVLYLLFHYFRLKLKINHDTVVLTEKKSSIEVTDTQGQISMMKSEPPTINISLEQNNHLKQKYQGNILGLSCQKILNFLHIISGGVVCFARGLNDTPKIAALLIAGQVLEIRYNFLIIAIAMVIGGLLHSRKVAHTMSLHITEMNTGQGFTANIVTGFLVIFASKLGVPVSTTHVSVGSIFGIGAAQKKIRLDVTRNILLSWVCTLPMATGFSYILYSLLKGSF